MTMGNLKNAIVCMAAGKSQVIVIEKAKSLGYAVIAVDRNPEAPGFALSDENLVLSTYDPIPIITALKELSARYNIVGVVNRASGPPVVTTAAICKALNLPGIEPEMAATILDKSKLMQLCQHYDIPAPVTQSVINFSEIDREKLAFPCIVKPALSLIGKSGVSIVHNNDQLSNAFAIAKTNSFNGIVNIEEYIRGRDVSLLAVVTKKKLYPVALLDELNIVDLKGCHKGTGFSVPSVYSSRPEEKSIIDLAERIVETLCLETTALNMSCRCIEGGQPKLIEIHLDLSGDLILDVLLPESTSFDVLKCQIETMTGGIPKLENINFTPTAVIFYDGDGLVSDRPYKILKSFDRSLLEGLIKITQRRMYGQ